MTELWKHYAKGKKEARYKRPHVLWFYFCDMPRIGKSMETESRLMVPRDWAERMRSSAPGFRVSFWGGKSVLKLDYDCTTQLITKNTKLKL